MYLHEGETEQHKQHQSSADSLHVYCVDLPPDVTEHPALFSSWHLRSSLLNGFSWQSGIHRLRSRDICRSSYKSVSKRFCRSPGILKCMVVAMLAELASSLQYMTQTAVGSSPSCVTKHHQMMHSRSNVSGECIFD